MNVQINALPVAPFVPLFGLDDAELARRGIVRRIAEKSPTSRCPCRVSLRDADAGSTVLLLNYEHLPVATPYRSSYAIFVREHATPAQLAPNEIPEVMQHRPLALRAFDRQGLLLDADLAQGEAEVSATLRRLLARADAAYVHVHNARHGCYVARADRAD